MKKLIFRMFLAFAVVLSFAACRGPAFLSNTISNFYEYEGKTYEVQEFHGNVSNMTMYEIVDGEKKFRGAYSLAVGAKLTPAELENKRRIENVIANGKKIAPAKRKQQPSVDFTIVDDE